MNDASPEVACPLDNSNRFRDLSGRRFTRLVVTAFKGRREHTGKTPRWECRCDCGTVKTVDGPSLTGGATKSCGCLSREIAASRCVRHGRYGTPEYKAWGQMLYRCRNPRCHEYPHYGGRGISFCERWLKFENFLSDMGERPSPKHTLDREDNDSNYMPENCRWVTRRTQQNNRRVCVFIEFDGRKQTVTEWAREVGIAPNSLRNRIRTGWPIEAALNPANRGSRSFRAA